MLTPLAEGEARELNAVAGILEALALSLAPAFEAEAIAELRAANAKLRALAAGGAGAAAGARAPDAAAVAVADHDFHRRLAEPCGDERLLTVLAPVRRSIYRQASAVAPTVADVERAVADHEAILDALVAGDHAGAAQRLREHVAAGLAELLAAGDAEPERGAGPAPEAP